MYCLHLWLIDTHVPQIKDLFDVTWQIRQKQKASSHTKVKLPAFHTLLVYFLPAESMTQTVH